MKKKQGLHYILFSKGRGGTFLSITSCSIITILSSCDPDEVPSSSCNRRHWVVDSLLKSGLVSVARLGTLQQ